MKLKKTAAGETLSMSRPEWQEIGQKAGWIPKEAKNWIGEAISEKDEGKFAEWCKKHGFKGVCQSCVDMALAEKPDGSKKYPHAAKMANFAVNVPDSPYENKKAELAARTIKVAAALGELGVETAQAVALLNWVVGAEVVPETPEGFRRAGGIPGIVRQLAMEPNFGQFALKAFDTAEAREKVIKDFLASQNAPAYATQE